MRQKPNPPASNDKKNDFVKSVILATERRNDAVHHRASIFLAANALLLTAVRGLGSPIPSSLTSSGWIWLGIGLLIVFLFSIATSSFCAVQVLAPFWYEKRMKVMKVTKDEFNVYWLGKISQFADSKAYSNAIESLTEQQLLEQLTNEAYNLSCLMMERYRWIHRAQRAVLVSIFALLGYAALVGLVVVGLI
jgi:pycsar effector protein